MPKEPEKFRQAIKAIIQTIQKINLGFGIWGLGFPKVWPGSDDKNFMAGFYQPPDNGCRNFFRPASGKRLV
jgi:hypothetical protein